MASVTLLELASAKAVLHRAIESSDPNKSRVARQILEDRKLFKKFLLVRMQRMERATNGEKMKHSEAPEGRLQRFFKLFQRSN